LVELGRANPEDEVDVTLFQFYVDAFRELGSNRQIGMGLGPIPFTSIVEYAKIYEVEDIVDFIYIIREMDNEYLRIQANEQKSDTKNPNKS
jgi:predicted ferric reductase